MNTISTQTLKEYLDLFGVEYPEAHELTIGEEFYPGILEAILEDEINDCRNACNRLFGAQTFEALEAEYLRRNPMPALIAGSHIAYLMNLLMDKPYRVVIDFRKSRPNVALVELEEFLGFEPLED